ncbi:ribonuclease HII [Homoserinimonas sp. OAct 916]|uniref:ribonuclease HII n=1 Tax=Homoserinimonas sp. OAct 916 TaxID=2211450 RepID=UPI000DBE2C34|nr:ribonuclease HII [Homoserinimonas sp. OAct 916]
MTPPADPTLEVERQLHEAGAQFVIGCDEVGRGALAGPVAVGLSVVDSSVGPIPEGLRDSKLLAEKRRTALAPLARDWSLYAAVGLASAREVDELGITACLGLAARRALVELHEAGAAITLSVVLLDGHQDWLNPALATPLRVVTRVKADRDCASVAAASVIAKVHRDQLMIEQDLRTPGYGWASNKGYGSAAHMAAIHELGPTHFHRRSWLKSKDELAGPTA